MTRPPPVVAVVPTGAPPGRGALRICEIMFCAALAPWLVAPGCGNGGADPLAPGRVGYGGAETPPVCEFTGAPGTPGNPGAMPGAPGGAPGIPGGITGWPGAPGWEPSGGLAPGAEGNPTGAGLPAEGVPAFGYPGLPPGAAPKSE